MNGTEYSGLRFDRRPARPRMRVIWIFLACLGFTLLWVFIPHNILFWFLLCVIAVFSWMTSYGWRRALADIHRLVDFLERL
jgi:hypothetical protein